MSEAIWRVAQSVGFDDYELRPMLEAFAAALSKPAPSPQAPGRRKGPPGITLEPHGHEQPSAPVVSDEQIIRAAVSAMPSTNPLVAEDLIGGHTMHTEAEDIVAIWKAGVQWQALHTATQPCGHPVSLVIRSAESGEALYCEACDDKSGRRDAEIREAELLEANQKIRDEILALRPAVEPMTLSPVEGDVLPAIGSKVLIQLASSDSWAEHEVVGYYVWEAINDLAKPRHHRVFVRVRDADGILNARHICDVRGITAKAEGGA